MTSTPARQYFRSQYGRPRISVSATCPTQNIAWLLGHTHVGTPAAEVEQDIRRRATSRRAEGVEGWTPKVEDEVVRFALWQHAENLAAYWHVMGGGR